ncbi:MAG: hypothetical protein IJ418_24075 [Clostridia bacterium]|nr:hypothetical protein [Clostridia bacterium]
MRVAKKGFGDEIPKQVWAAAQRIPCFVHADYLLIIRKGVFDYGNGKGL